ncbi:cell division protein FtsZ [Luteithermobacter gelatinilyticus]|uniref:cell division protein FtsZ n=1 Tax=Luteithermobacter gelatinilyticus TaxID=2582913 RepID=UPI0011066049|nr:cell division protein FtsZ [Luteithermobacter gelatinilyticus]|tara:strand:- start:403 stop:2178 length:1776 start_codon:yes stop_codon:yes gene_type:complete
MTIEFTTPELTELQPKITVFGVGGAGGNAVNNMIAAQLQGVDFIVANTDAQALAHSRAEQKIQLGAQLTQGLGAGARPEVGRAAAEETLDKIEEYLQGAHMAFITAGMGGGTGTGAAPIIAKAAREKGILTVGVVTKPFQFEGSRRMALAEQGISELSQYVDTLIIIPNQNLFRIANERTTFADAFAMADEVLHSGVRGITDLMVMPGLVNLDFADVRTVMSEMGKAMMGTGEAEGDGRALEAAEAAISNPLLDEVSMKGAKGVLINITGGMDLTLFEVDEAANRIRSEVDPDANILVGSALNPELEGKMRVSVVATGIDATAQPKVETPIRTYDFNKPSQKTEEPAAEEATIVADATPEEREDLSGEAYLEEPLELQDEVREETEELFSQLDDSIVEDRQVEAETVEPAIEEDREAPFIAPEPVLPERKVQPLSDKPDPYAEAALANAQSGEERPSRLNIFGSMLGGKKKAKSSKEPVLRQGDLLGGREEEEPSRASGPSGTDREEAEPSSPPARNPLRQKPAAPRTERPQEQAAKPATEQADRASADRSAGRGPLTAGERIVPRTPSKPAGEREEDHLEIPAFLRRQAN